jgi:hypothetical protein
MKLNRRNALILLGAAPLGGALATPALAAKPKIFTADGFAIHGADPTEFFNSGKAVTGSPGLVHYWKRTKFLFVSMENMQQFAKDPPRYVPQYGGYCAFAVARGELKETVPEAWTIYKGKLYLNQTLAIRTQWKADMPGNIAKANKFWPGLVS